MGSSLMAGHNNDGDYDGEWWDPFCSNPAPRPAATHNGTASEELDALLAEDRAAHYAGRPATVYYSHLDDDERQRRVAQVRSECEPGSARWRLADIEVDQAARREEETLSPVDDEPYVDWQDFWTRDRDSAEWIVEDVLARGRGHAIFAGHKQGKSLFVLSSVTKLAADDNNKTVVVYLDYEMADDDLYERLADMGYGPQTDLSRVKYWQLPSMPPLNTPEGAEHLERRLTRLAEQYPDHHIIVIIDTTSRAVQGDENDASTIQAFYRHTGIMLKRRGVTYARLDHTGKDPTKGQRGSSAKGDDVDIVWKLTKTDDGIILKREAARMGWVPDKVAFAMRDEPLEYVRTDIAWPAGTAEVATTMDRLGVPIDASIRAASNALSEAGQGRAQVVVRAAIKYRKKGNETP
jgi:RecA-family ATPase